MAQPRAGEALAVKAGAVTAGAVKARILPLDPARYESHALHRGERAWLETNCYVDLWIEALHGFGFDPTAALPFTITLDFEGDQWLFFKQPTGDLLELYGVDVQELNIWRSLQDHVVEQVSRGRLVLVEMDAFYLPDTAGVSYGLGHTKTTIGIQAIDTEARTLEYFHNAGYFALGREDYTHLFGLDREKRVDELVPYTEFAKIDSSRAVPDAELASRSLVLLRKHLARAPRANPITAFRARFEQDIEWLKSEPQEVFHQYAFASLRQCGACYELAASYVRWLEARGETDLQSVAEAFETLSSQAKTLQFKAARAVVLKRPVDFAPMLNAMESAWTTALETLRARYG
jgi:hypothetical protein